jgi:hypothetical protein
MFCEKIMNQQGGMCQSVVMMAQPFFSPPQISPFSPHCLSAFSSPSDNIACSLSGHEVEICDALCPRNQKTQSASLSHWTKLSVLFWVWKTFFRPTVNTGFFCFNITAISSSFIYCDDVRQKVFISSYTVNKPFTDINMILFLIMTQK